MFRNMCYIGLIVITVSIVGCNFNDKDKSKTIVDQVTTQKPETTFDPKNIPDKHMIFNFPLDAMNRDASFPRNLVINTSYYEKNSISRGDILYMEFSDDFIKQRIHPTNEQDVQNYRKLISRVIGLPGEKIKINQGQIYINNKKLDSFYGHQTFHNQPVPKEESVSMKEDVLVPENHVFVMPDEWWRGSVDSSGMGTIDREFVKGKVVGFIADN